MSREHDETRRTLSPKQVAKAFDVSESSLKRWCDQGRIPMTKTAGGHRRLSWSDVLTFVRHQGRPLVDPEALGIGRPQSGTALQESMDQLTEQLESRLAAGDETSCRQIILSALLAGHSIATLCDMLLAQSLRRLGDRWECGQLEIYEERRACEIVGRVMTDCATYIPDTHRARYRALGAAPEGDLYALPTRMVELVLRESGWQAISLGNNIPLRSLMTAAQREEPDWVWVSVSVWDAEKENQLVGELHELHAGLPPKTRLLVGGRALHAGLREQLTFADYRNNLQHLSVFARNWPQPAVDVVASP